MHDIHQPSGCVRNIIVLVLKLQLIAWNLRIFVLTNNLWTSAFVLVVENLKTYIPLFCVLNKNESLRVLKPLKPNSTGINN